MNASPPKKDKIRAFSDQVDEYFNALLVDGMPWEDVERIEKAREAAHEKIKQQVLQKAFGR